MHTQPTSTDTIVAVSSPPGRSLRGLIRWSGPDAIAGVNALLHDALRSEPGRVQKVRLVSPAIPALVMLAHGPRSYTGQDTAELQAPGHPALLERLLRDALRHPGVRLAEPGEFTQRAFLNGKLDLTQAEGVAATVSAASRAQLKAAERLRQGQLADRASDWVDTLANHLALVEAGIDFTDQEDVVPISPGELSQALAALHEKILELQRRHRSWSEVEHLPRVVFVGPPSVGKSTLMNHLLGQHRAVIAAQPGTTRDVLEAPLTLHTDGRSIDIMLVDIAGLDAPRSQLDEQAQAAAARAIDHADLLISVTDGQRMTPRTLPSGTPRLTVRTHADLHALLPDESDFDAVTQLNDPATIEAIKPMVLRALGQSAMDAPPDALYLQPRHEAAISAACAALEEAADLLSGHEHERALPHSELIASAMRAGLDALASLGGTVTPDDVIGRVFATFCVGK